MSKISVTPGSGEDVTTDTVSAQKVQVVKIMAGATTVDGGLVATGNPLPVVQTGTHNIGTVTTVTTVAAVTAVGTITPGTAASSLGKAEDAAHSSGDVGVMALGVQKATPADISTEGDYTPLQVDSGQVWVKLGTAIPAGTAAIGKLAANSGVDIGDVDITSITPGTSAGSLGKAEDAAHASGDTGVAVWAVQQATPADNAADGDYAALKVSGGHLWIRQAPQLVRIQVDITRFTGTTQYTADDAWSDSDSAPTAGGFVFTGCARYSGGGGTIIKANFATSADPATKLQGELCLFNTTVTNINDNTAFAVSDSEIKTLGAVIGFTMADAGNNGFYAATNLNEPFVCSGSANLYGLVRVKNAYTPVSAEVLTCTLWILQDG